MGHLLAEPCIFSNSTQLSYSCIALRDITFVICFRVEFSFEGNRKLFVILVLELGTGWHFSPGITLLITKIIFFNTRVIILSYVCYCMQCCFLKYPWYYCEYNRLLPPQLRVQTGLKGKGGSCSWRGEWSPCRIAAKTIRLRRKAFQRWCRMSLNIKTRIFRIRPVYHYTLQKKIL